jgi:hypothetical protein
MRNTLPFAGLVLAGLLATALTAQAQTPAFIRWTLKRGATDSAAVRSGNITPGTTRFRRFVVSSGQTVSTNSTGTTTAAYPAYTGSYGQAFATNASGGGWASSATPPGPGSAVRRVNYEEFSFAVNGATQVDSLIFTAAVTNSTGFAGLTYSMSGFATDSAEFTGGKGPAGLLAATANGTFTAVGGTPSNSAAANRLPLPQYDTTLPVSTRTFRMAFNGATGLALTAGNTLAVRLHFATGSANDGRYVVLRDVIMKAKQVALASRSAVATILNVYPNPATDQVAIPHAAATAEARLLVYSTTGARVLSQPVARGTRETALSLAALPKGLYLVEYADGEQRSTARIVKE